MHWPACCGEPLSAGLPGYSRSVAEKTAMSLKWIQVGLSPSQLWGKLIRDSPMCDGAVFTFTKKRSARIVCHSENVPRWLSVDKSFRTRKRPGSPFVWKLAVSEAHACYPPLSEASKTPFPANVRIGD
jgi:hypothetical protein